MLSSLVERLQRKVQAPEASRYAAWAAALKRLDRDGAKGRLPEIDELTGYLEGVPKAQRRGALEDLVAIHLRHAWATGSGQALEAYGAEIAELGRVEDLPVDLIEDEFLARYQQPHGDLAELRRYENRFSARPEVAARLRSRYLDAGRYLKLHRIGVGAKGVVWEGFDLRACRSVAIKEPLVKPGDGKQNLRPFAHEAEITATLDHPGIVSVVEVNRRSQNKDDFSFYVMRLAGRNTLDERIHDCHRRLTKFKKSPGPRRTLGQLLEAVARVCDAIAYAHAQGVLHCDLKPANVVCDERCNIGVIDWGMAIRIGEAVEAGGGDRQRRLAGTPDYMAPEQVDGLFDIRTEVFGLGAILYETLTGRPPYVWDGDGVAERPEDWPEQVKAGAFPAPRKVRRSISKALQKVCRKAMAVDPDQRYASAAELATELRQCLSTGDVGT